jgi:hypothetical protein
MRAVAAKAPGGVLHREGHHRADEQEDRRQRRIQVQHVGEQRDGREAVAHQGRDGGGRGGGHVLDVVGELGQELAGAVMVVVARRRPQQVVEHLLAQVRDHAPPDPLEAVVVDEAGDTADQEHPTSRIGISRTTFGSRSTKLPSSSGLIMAANSGSVDANTSMPTMDSANMRQYGFT